jgi:hypothetical protein
MSPNAIYSKSGKGVQEASGKTSQLARADRAVLSAIDGKMTLGEVADKVGRPFDAKFEELIGKLDKDGFVRQVSAGAPAPAAAPAPARPGAAKPAAPGGKAPGEDLDFTIAMPSPKAAAPKAATPPPAPPVAPHMAQTQAAAFAKAREEAEEKAARERDRIKAETEAKMRAEMEAKARSEAELKSKSDAEARVRAEAEAKVKAAREAAVRAAAEAKAKAEAEAAAKLEAERARVREAEEKARREAEQARREAEEAKRKAEEEARKAREEAERVRREAEEAKRQAEEAKRKAEEEARRIREEAERKAREEAERRRKDEEARRAREEQERKEREAREKQEREARDKAGREAREQEEREDKERKAREKAEREAREREEEAREAQEKAERKARERAEREQREREEEEREAQERAARKARDKEQPKEERKEKEKAPAKPESFGDSLLADLDSFSQRDEEERKAKEEAERKEKEAAQRRAAEAARQAKEQAEREAKEKAEREAREKEERQRKEEEERQEREEAERREQEEKERARREEKERKRRAKEAPKAAAGGDDIPVSDDDLDMDEVKKDEAILTKESRRAAREREERERQAKKDAQREAKRAAKEDKDEKRASRREEPASPPQFRRPRKWGKTVSMTLFLLLVAAVGAVHVMPVSTAEYESAASQAVGRPVKIGSGRISLYSGVQLRLQGVSVGEAKIASVRAFPEIGSLFGEKKAFSRIELEGVTVPQAAAAELFGAKVRGDNFTVGKVSAKQVKLSGPLQIPTLEVDLAIGADGSVTSTSLRGPEGLSGKLTPKGASEMEVDVVAHTFTVPMVPDMSLSGFAMKGVATRDGVKIESWGGSSLDGAVSGSANVRWGGGNWVMDGVMTVRGINAAVFAPALLSEGRAEGTGRFSFSDADPMSFLGRGRIEGTFSVHKGVLGSFDLSRAIQTGGRQAAGRTPFTGLSGQGVFDKGAVALRNVSFGAGALNAGASADIAADGNLSGRIVADVKTPSQTLRATLNLGGTVRDPQVRN